MLEAFTFYVVDCDTPQELQDRFNRQRQDDLAVLGQELLEHLHVVASQTFDCDDDAMRFIENKSANTARQGLAWAVRYRVPEDSKRLRAAHSKLNAMIKLLKIAGGKRDSLESRIAMQRETISHLKRSLGARSDRTRWIIGGLPKTH